MIRKAAFILILSLTLFNGCKTANGPKFIPDKTGSERIITQGLLGARYSGEDLTRLSDAMVIDSLNIVWNAVNSFGNSWSAQWEGYLTAPVSGSVVFYGETDQKLVVTIAGNEVLTIPFGSGSDTKDVKLKKGRKYHINVKYLQKTKGSATRNGETFFKMEWAWNGTPKHPIPGESLHFGSVQEGKWKYIGENYQTSFSYKDNSDYPLDPIQIKAPELANLDFTKWTGGLPVVPGIQTYTICRADREHPEKAEGLGYTYQHHQDIAAWHGRLYVGWNTCKVDEDEWPSREVYSTSLNGKEWSEPVEMFPQGISTPLRMYFFLSPNGRMLMIAGLRENNESLNERQKSGIVVREIFSNHSLGEVYTLRNAKKPVDKQPPFFTNAPDKAFIEACNLLLEDHLYLSQQDYGNLLNPEDRMKWCNPESWGGDDQLRDIATEFGKAMCFFERKDGTIVGLSKRRWVTTSNDGGKTWSQPVRPKSLITAGGKVWGQPTSNGRYVLIYNPDPEKRWPLMVLTSNDGITFSNPMAINGELPGQRYEGKFKDIGVSYHRGLSKWNNDGSWKDDAIWLVYSLNKEDILISRVPSSI